MSVTEDDVRHIAALARLGLDPARVPHLMRELNGILAHMDVLSAVDSRAAADGRTDVEDMTTPVMMTRADEGPSIPLSVPREAFAPEMRDGFFLVPRLATHEDAEDAP